MTFLSVETIEVPKAQQVLITDELLTLHLSDGRIISVPLAWYPRLFHGSEAERNQWQWTGSQTGIHWPDLDEDISIKNILLGQPSGESQKSLQGWLESRRNKSDTVANN